MLARPLTTVQRTVEFETHDDLREAVAKLDGTEFKGNRVTCIAEVTVCITLYMWIESSRLMGDICRMSFLLQ